MYTSMDDVGKDVFIRFYVYLGVVKEGFRWCKKFIKLDGCGLKGAHKGQLLIACGRDDNSGIYPISYAINEIESNESWN